MLNKFTKYLLSTWTYQEFKIHYEEENTLITGWLNIVPTLFQKRNSMTFQWLFKDKITFFKHYGIIIVNVLFCDKITYHTSNYNIHSSYFNYIHSDKEFYTKKDWFRNLHCKKHSSLDQQWWRFEDKITESCYFSQIKGAKQHTNRLDFWCLYFWRP